MGQTIMTIMKEQIIMKKDQILMKDPGMLESSGPGLGILWCPVAILMSYTLEDTLCLVFMILDIFWLN